MNCAIPPFPLFITFVFCPEIYRVPRGIFKLPSGRGARAEDRGQGYGSSSTVLVPMYFRL